MRQRLRGARSRRRGATLVESLIALVVISVGTAAITELLKYISEASRRMAFQSTALDVYGEVVAYVEDARCNVVTQVPRVEQYDPIVQRMIARTDWMWLSRAGGRLVESAAPPAGPVFSGVAQATAPVWVAIRRVGPPPATNAVGPPVIAFEVQVRERMHDAGRDSPALESGYWIRILPAKKVCSFRDEVQGRGELF